ncbi:MAG TPA: hypothetical protein PK545_08590, partial [Deltaproteobacteria bacterium]|nr:hypothetical protein [Deltaproteobacteria bacterium]
MTLWKSFAALSAASLMKERFYNAIDELHDRDFVAAVFKNLELDIEVDPADLASVPKDGPLM